MVAEPKTQDNFLSLIIYYSSPDKQKWLPFFLLYHHCPMKFLAIVRISPTIFLDDLTSGLMMRMNMTYIVNKI